MKKLTIKLKITLWFMIFMILLSAVFFAFTIFVCLNTMMDWLSMKLILYPPA